MLGPMFVLAVLGICSGLLAVYLTLRVPSGPAPEAVQERLDAIQAAIGPASPVPDAAALPEGEAGSAGRPRSVTPGVQANPAPNAP